MKGEGIVNKGLNVTQINLPIRNATRLSEDLSNLDLFGMGYPYHVRFYAEKYIAVSSDYGVLLFEVNI